MGGGYSIPASRVKQIALPEPISRLSPSRHIMYYRQMVTLFLDARPIMCYHPLPVRRDFFLAFGAIGQGKIGGVL
jgi:hypothetical protein